MRLSPALSFIAHALKGLTLATAVVGVSSLAMPVQDELGVPEAVHERALLWSGFAPQRFDGAAVEPTASWEVTIAPPPGALKYMILGFTQVTARPGDYRIELRDQASHLLARYDADFLAANPRFTTSQLPPQAVRVKVIGPAASGELQFLVDRMLVAQQHTLSKSLIPNLTVYGQMTPAERQAARGLAKLIIDETEVCSAFLVAADTLVTNYHCLRRSKSYANSPAGAKRCADIAVSFDYVRDPYATTGNPKCMTVIKAVPPPVDVAVLKLYSPPPNALARTFQLAPADPSESGQPARIYQHPWGFPLGLVRGCTVKSLTSGERKLEHSCNSLGGASGSPILNDAGEVVGIHSNGYIADGASQVEVMETWYAACNAGKCPTNLGTGVSKIREALR